MIGLDSYDNRTKDSWRGWQWNRIMERLAMRFEIRPSPAELKKAAAKWTVLYLCGPDDIDRESALKRGFSNENLIAIDINSTNIDKVRESGGLGVSARLQDVIASWSDDWKLDVVVADTCHGFSKAMSSLLMTVLFNPALSSESVISVNMIRGHDEHTNILREGVAYIKPKQRTESAFYQLLDELHRGKQFAVEYVRQVNAMCEIKKIPFDGDSFITKAMSPAFYSYHGCGNHINVMDCIIFKKGVQLTYIDALAKERVFTDNYLFIDPKSTPRSLLKTRRKLAALKAVRTKRLS